jgi:hypothetical protein
MGAEKAAILRVAALAGPFGYPSMREWRPGPRRWSSQPSPRIP